MKKVTLSSSTGSPSSRDNHKLLSNIVGKMEGFSTIGNSSKVTDRASCQ